MDDSELVTLMLVGGHEVYGRITQQALGTIYEWFVQEPRNLRMFIRLDEPPIPPLADDSKGSELAVPLRNIVAVRTYK